MTPARRIVLVALVWVLVVAGGSTLVWWAIGRAGQGVTGEVAGPAATGASPGEQSPGTPTSADAGVEPTPTSSGSPAPTPSGTPTSGGVVEAEQSSTTVAGGTVTVACRGAVITLVGARPRVGWSLDSERRSDQVEVRFEVDAESDEAGADGDDQVRVRASCVDGSPVFSD